MVPFKVLKVEEVDGRLYVEWESVGDDGLTLIEGDYLEVEATEDAVTEAVEAIRQRRAEINARPKPQPKKQKRTPVLDVARLNARIEAE